MNELDHANILFSHLLRSSRVMICLPFPTRGGSQHLSSEDVFTLSGDKNTI